MTKASPSLSIMSPRKKKVRKKAKKKKLCSSTELEHTSVSDSNKLPRKSNVLEVFIKRRLQHRCFPVKFATFLRTPCFAEYLWWLLLNLLKSTLVFSNSDESERESNLLHILVITTHQTVTFLPQKYL